jgi:hypothetical protein
MEPGWRWLQPFRRPASMRSARREGGRPARQEISRAARISTAKPEGVSLIWQEISRAHVGRAAWGGTGRSRTMGRTARQTPPEGTGPDKGRGPSTHEMEGPIRSSGARHSYLMLSVRTTRSNHQAGNPPEDPVAQFPLRPGCPPDGSVFGSERFLRLSRAAAQEVSASNFKIFWPSTNCPQFSPSYPPVDPLSPHEIHR